MFDRNRLRRTRIWLSDNILAADEHILELIPVRRGANPYAFLLRWLRRSAVIAVTERDILLVALRTWIVFGPPKVIERVPGSTRLATSTAHRWNSVVLGHRQVWTQRANSRRLVDATLSRPTRPEGGGEVRGGGVVNVYLPIGLFAACIGLVDALTASSGEYRLIGLAVLLIGALLLSACGVLLLERTRRTWGRLACIPAGIAAAVLCGYLAIDSAEYGRVFVTVPFTLIGLAALGLCARRPFPTDYSTGTVIRAADSTTSRAFKGAASFGISASLAFSVFQFWYSNHATAVKHGAGLALSGVLTDKGLSGDKGTRLFTAAISTKNASGGRVEVLGSLYYIVGVTFSPSAPNRNYLCGTVSSDLGSQQYLDQGTASELGDYSVSHPLEIGTFVGDESILDPDDEVSASLIIALPEAEVKKYSAIRLILSIASAKGTRMNTQSNQSYAPANIIDKYDYIAPQRSCPIDYTQAIPPADISIARAKQSVKVERTVKAIRVARLARVWALTRGQQEVVVIRSLGSVDIPDISPSVEVCVADEGRTTDLYLHYHYGCSHSSREFKAGNFFGLFYEYRSIDTPLTNAAAPASGGV